MLSPDYVDGRFFRVTLLTDERFADASLVFGGPVARSDGGEPEVPRAAAGRGRAPHVRRRSSSRRGCARSRAIATWGGLLLEALVALLCLIPAEGLPRIQIARHASLLAFCVTTYALAPVAGFGWLLATMGLAQCRPDQKSLRGAYLAVFVLILCTRRFPGPASWRIGRLADRAPSTTQRTRRTRRTRRVQARPASGHDGFSTNGSRMLTPSITWPSFRSSVHRTSHPNSAAA